MKDKVENQHWGNDLNLLLSILAYASMASAITALFLDTGSRVSAGLTTVWIGIEALLRTRDLPWSWGLLAIVLLNIRGIVVGDGAQPVSHMDYVLIITSFLLGFGRSAKSWQRSAALCCIACGVGVLLRFEIILDFARWGIEYQAPTLTKNQTALLGGFASSCGVMALLLSRNRHWWPLLIPSTGLCLLLSYATTSRAALALTPLSAALALSISWREPIAHLLKSWLERHWRRMCWVLAGTMMAALASAQRFLSAPVATQLAAMYGRENLENDLGRLKVYSCYAELPFKGENRFFYGVGYQNSWQKWCTPEVLGRQLHHAHNLLLQIWGDAGAVPTVFLLICFSLILIRIWRNSLTLSWRTNTGVLSVFIYISLFNMVELGVLKVPALMASLGYFMSAIYLPHETSIQVNQNNST